MLAEMGKAGDVFGVLEAPTPHKHTGTGVLAMRVGDEENLDLVGQSEVPVATGVVLALYELVHSFTRVH